MAGGVGSRFWPMSTTEKPKQFIDVLGVGKSLLQLTMDRFSGICTPENVWVVTNKDYAEMVKEQLPEIPVSNILCVLLQGRKAKGILKFHAGLAVPTKY